MEIYSDMTFRGDPRDLESLLGRLDELGGAGVWRRDREAEADIEGLTSDGGPVRCYRNAAPSESLPDCRLWLDIDRRHWEVTNIVPSGEGPLPPPVYSALLSSFRAALRPLYAGTSIQVSEPVHEVGPEHWLTPNALRLLRQFSALANKSTGASHPRDRARWNAFVIAAHREQCKIGGSELGQILIEDQHWPESKASDLAILFEYEQSLLDHLDKSA